MSHALEAVAMDRTFLWGDGFVLSRAEMFARVQSLAAELPERRYALNLTTGRGAFVVGFLAAMQRGHVNLLPPSRAIAVVRDFKRMFPDSYILTDHDDLAVDGPSVVLHFDGHQAIAPAKQVLSPPADQLAAITFTSGSTGGTKAHPKFWGSLETGARLAARRFEIAPDVGIVATVPPQHMYGLETSVFYPLIAGCSVHYARPMFPVEVREALCAVNTPRRLLVTTPIHLRSLVAARMTWPRIDRIISATAPLTKELAAAAERRLGAPVHEIYGCTEAGSLASRRTVAGDVWEFYDGVEFAAEGLHGSAIVEGGHVWQPTPLTDILAPVDKTSFRLLGRDADQVSIAGKRASLGDLNARLATIDGIDDGVFIAPKAADGARVERLGALFVSATLDEQAVMARLQALIDPVFLPRPIRRVQALPRNELGKLPRHELLALLRPETGFDQHDDGRAAGAA